MELSITEKVTKTIALNMIVKNESHIIEKTLQNLCDYISFDYWVICDTGSTDDTQNIIKAFFKSKHIPGELHQCEWKDFGTNRTEALEKAFNKTDYLLVFDADDSIHGEFHLPTLWNFDSYCLKFGNPANDSVYKRVLLINNRKKYAFHGVLHEFIVGITKDITETTIKGDYYLVSGREGARSKNPNKYLDDAKVLEQGFNDEIQDESLKNRYAFYCAQSYKDAGETDTAIMWFKKSLELPLWVQEKYYSCYQLGYLYQQKGESEKAIHYWLKTSQYDSQRIEGIVAACNKYKEMGMNDMAVALYKYYENYADWSHNLYEKLFVDTNKYRHELEYHCSIAAGYTQQKQYGYECCKRIILLQQQPASIVDCTISNLRYYKEFLRKDEDSLAFFYALDPLFGRLKEDPENTLIWKILFDNNRKKCTQKPCLLKTPQNHSKPFIFLSFTTCKRWDLFQQTMNSLLNHWQDYAKIDYWFCVDDNSSEQDRTSMRTAYPWMDYYMKSPEEKGHRASMNIIWEKLNELKPTYWIHMEDDFLFHRKYNYIEKSIECLQTFKERNIKQVLFNRGYGETIEDYSIVSYIPLNDDFSLHDHKQGHFNTRNCHYWPHYSFRPSLVEVDAILRLGNFDSPNQFFEMDYANKWNNAGYQSAFLNLITNRHIGRLTSERHNKDLPNAYELNNEEQFIQKTPFIKIINLKRRVDRKKSTMGQLEKAELQNYSFIKAYDGKSLKATSEMKKLFKGNDFGNRRGVIGCALSHYNLWKALIEDKNHAFYLIMEDDFTLCEGFKERMEILKKEMETKEVLFLGYHMFAKEREKVKEIYDHLNNNIKVAQLNQSLFVGGTHCYSINTKGAQKMLDYIEKNGIKHGIDFVIGKLNSDLCYETQPHLCFSIWAENNKKIDSDIQYDNTSINLDFSSIHIINLERRKDRKKKMIKKMEENDISYYDFFTAFDGTLLKSTAELKWLFEGNDFDNNRGVIGCAMSHLTLWKQLLGDKENEFYLILEDDIDFIDNFQDIFKKVVEFDQKDIIFLGYSMGQKERDKIDKSNTLLQCNKLNKKRYIGGFFSYLINKKGAEKLVNYIEINGIKHGIDYLVKIIDTLDCYETQPQLTFTTWNENARLIDSDIQHFYTRMSFQKNNFIFVQGLDQIGKDLFYQKASIEQCIERADKDEHCVGFNTLGFFKNEIDDLTPSPYFGKADGIYIKKEHYEKYQLKKSSDNINPNSNPSKQKIVFLTLTNSGYLDYTKNCLLSLTNIGSDIPLHCYCVDETAYNDLKRIHKFTYLLNNSENKCGGEFICNGDNPTWANMMNNKIKIISDALESYDLVLFTDGDIVYEDSTFFNYCIQNMNNYDLIAQADDSLICAGFMLIRSNKTTKKVFKQIFEKINEVGIGDDQQWMNKDFIRNQLKYKLLPRDLYPSGGYYMRYNPPTPHMIHFNCLVGNQKMEKMKYYKKWYIQEKSNEKQEKQTSRVPYKIIRIKMLCNWCSSEELCRQWSTMCEEDFRWKDIELTSNDENIDYYVIINKPQEGAKYNPKKTIIFQMEPWIYNATKNWGVHTWGKWSIPDEKKFLYVGRHKNDLNNVQWQIKIPPIIPDASKRLDKAFTCLSGKDFDWGHKKRIEFLKKLGDWQKEEANRESLIDIYGRENYHSLANYKGPLKDDKKENHYVDYKYCFAVENNSERNYATEKIWEPILCECLTFYWGCPGLEKHINEKAFVRLDITDFEGSLATIQQAIKEDWWSQRIDIIRQEKQKILDELGFFPRLEKIIKDGEKK